jgi:hypothetical protein
MWAETSKAIVVELPLRTHISPQCALGAQNGAVGFNVCLLGCSLSLVQFLFSIYFYILGVWNLVLFLLFFLFFVFLL